MKLTIEHSNTKRTVNGSFSVCGSRADVESLRRQLDRALKDESWSYGWVAIYADAPSRLPESQPVPWD